MKQTTQSRTQMMKKTGPHGSHTRTRALCLLAALALGLAMMGGAAFLVGCEAGPRSCASARDCLGDEQCSAGRCEAVRSCQSEADCLGDEQCVAGSCRSTTPVSPEPTADGGTPRPDTRSAPDVPKTPDAPGVPDHPTPKDRNSIPEPPGGDEPPPEPRKPPVTPGTRFASSPAGWLVPSESFCAVAQASSSKYWSVMDIDGDGKPDLVWTRDPNGSTSFVTNGAAHWNVFKNQGSGFARRPVAWAVPTPTFDRTAYAYGSKHWSVMDIDGDNKPDLVWTRDPNSSTAFVTNGVAHWKVFKNTGSGFAKNPVNWTVPTPTFDRTTYAYGSKYWVVMDIDGDQKPDLVWTRDPNNSTAFVANGVPHWKVFKNTGSGFAKSPVSWAVPTPTFDRTTYAYGSKYWVVMDLDGDKKPDLVWTRDPNSSTAFVSGGAAHWKVFQNQGSGFAKSPVSWAVPTPTFDRTAYAYGSKYWSVMDIDGDQKPDLVWTRDPNSSTAFVSGGAAHWKVFKNAGSGFAKSPVSWAVPTPTFDRTTYAYGSKYWAVMDLDGDKKPDLVWTRDPNASSCEAFGSTSGAQWRVFFNQ